MLHALTLFGAALPNFFFCCLKKNGNYGFGLWAAFKPFFTHVLMFTWFGRSCSL